MTQTFLPSPNFSECAKVLDTKRLGKNITESFQVYRYIVGTGKMQGNPHPYAMWKGYHAALLEYICAMHKEWVYRFDSGARGGKRFHKNGIEAESLALGFKGCKTIYPDWLGCEKLHSSQRAALLYKNLEWYSQFGWKESPAIPLKINRDGSVTLPYYWVDTEE